MTESQRDLLGRAGRRLRRLVDRREARLVEALDRHRIPRHRVRLRPGEHHVVFPELGLEVALPGEEWILPIIPSALGLAGRAGCQLTRSGDGGLVCEAGGVRFGVHGASDVDVMYEILGEDTYALRVPRKDLVVVDVGANVGLASLYLAQKLECPVVSFEPFLPTRDRMLQNLALNAKLASGIEVRPVGLSDRRENLELPYSPAKTEWMGPEGAEAARSDQAGETLERIELVPASGALREIKARYAGRAMLLKVDCEGSEYKIFDDLMAHQGLENVVAIMLEWHRFRPEHDPEALLRRVTTAGFFVLEQRRQSPMAGMAYAFRA